MLNDPETFWNDHWNLKFRKENYIIVIHQAKKLTTKNKQISIQQTVSEFQIIR